MPRYFLFVVPVAAFLGLAVVFYLQLGRDPSIVPSALIDKPAPSFTLPPLDAASQGIATADLKGEVVLVNVFASWCIPCKAEHPILTRLAAEGWPIYGINYKDKPEDARDWLAKLGNPYRRIGADRDGRVGIEWGVYGVPETFILDREGHIRYRHVGPIHPFELDEKILPVLKKLKP